MIDTNFYKKCCIITLNHKIVENLDKIYDMFHVFDENIDDFKLTDNLINHETNIDFSKQIVLVSNSNESTDFTRKQAEFIAELCSLSDVKLIKDVIITNWL